jgi:hypothetical protein
MRVYKTTTITDRVSCLTPRTTTLLIFSIIRDSIVGMRMRIGQAARQQRRNQHKRRYNDAADPTTTGTPVVEVAAGQQRLASDKALARTLVAVHAVSRPHVLGNGRSDGQIHQERNQHQQRSDGQQNARQPTQRSERRNPRKDAAEKHAQQRHDTQGPSDGRDQQLPMHVEAASIGKVRQAIGDVACVAAFVRVEQMHVFDHGAFRGRLRILLHLVPVFTQ